MNQSHNDDDLGAAGTFGLLMVFALLLVITTLPGWMAARAGKSYKTVRMWIAPTAIVMSQFFGGMMFLCLGWVIALIFGSRDLANYVMNATSELTLLSAMFDDPRTIPIWHIVLFQVILWFTIGKRMTRHFTFSIYDFAIQSIAKRSGIHPYTVRQGVINRDTGYTEAARVYVKTGKPPLLGLLLVGLSRTPLDEYY